MPEKQRGEEWQNSKLQKKLFHFKSDAATVHAKWIDISDDSLVPPRPIHVKVVHYSS